MMAKWKKVHVGRWERPGAYVRQLSDGGDWLANSHGEDGPWAYVATAQEGMEYIDSVLDGEATLPPIDITDHAATMAKGLKAAEEMDGERGGPYPAYSALYDVLSAAYFQASEGKGKDRHTDGGGIPFDQQPIVTITREQGLGFPLGQTMKKALEANRMAKQGKHQAAEAELLGAIVYTAAAVLRLRELAGEDDDFEDVKIGGTG